MTLNKRKKRPLVVLTGITSGLGRAMIAPFTEHGWMIVGCGRRKTDIKNLQNDYPQHDFSIVDVTDEQAVHAWCQHIHAQYGTVDMLMNNAAIIGGNAPAWEIPLTTFNQVMTINVMGVVNMIHHLMFALSQNAVIINMSSLWGREGAANQAAYCASKFAIEGFTQSLAQDISNNITVVTLEPGGGIATSMLSTCLPDLFATAPSAEDWAKVAVPYILNITHKDHGKALTCPPI